MKMRKTFYLFLVFLVSFSISMIPDTSFAISMDDPELVARETAQIEKFKERVKREGDTLLLKNKSGSFISVKDSPDCNYPISCAAFKFLEYFEDIGFFLIQGYYWESGQHILISESDGIKHYIHELPIFSPDKRHLVTTPNNLDTGNGRSGVFIWRIEGNKIISEFSYEPKGYVWYELVKWNDNTSIEFNKWLNSSKGLCSETRYMIVPVNLKMEDGDWNFYEDLSPNSVKCNSKYLRR